MPGAMQGAVLAMMRSFPAAGSLDGAAAAAAEDGSRQALMARR